jgi:hypothetical protein
MAYQLPKFNCPIEEFIKTSTYNRAFKPPAEVVKPPAEVVKPPADVEKKTAEVVKKTAEAVKPPADVEKTPVDVVKPPAEAVKRPGDGLGDDPQAGTKAGIKAGIPPTLVESKKALNDMYVRDLRILCETLGIDKKGKKISLVNRIIQKKKAEEGLAN